MNTAKEQEMLAPIEEKLTLMQKAKKTAVAISGGALVAIGIPLIPLPVPGCLVIAGGLSVLATEFPAAQKVLDKGTDKLREFGNGSNDGRTHEDELGLGFEVIEDPNAKTTPTPVKRGVERLRSVTRDKIVPLIDGHPTYTTKEKVTSSRTADTFKSLYW